jgi:pantoate--beta-alanine ligase
VRIVTTARELRDHLAAHRRRGQRIAFVPTMGNLHEGHYALIDEARRHGDVVVASVFVNPAQFGPNEDFARYPRTPDEDAQGLERRGCDVLFLPAVAEIYPDGAAGATRVVPPARLATTLEGAIRPGHFEGVATVVAILFHLVQPDVAVFGRKDYQQLLVVRGLVRDLAFPIAIVDAPTRRDCDGLALSSRNRYLDDAERVRAVAIHATLRWIAAELRSGAPLAAIEHAASRQLVEAGLIPDYVSLRRALDLEIPDPGERTGLVALVAARAGAVRLIDNRLLDD